jgi:hypothetical protein
MKRLIILVGLVLTMLTISASAAVADGCACGGGDYLYWGPYYHPPDYPGTYAGHYDCIWYRAATNSYQYIHGC